MNAALQAWLFLGAAVLIGAALFPTTVGGSLGGPVSRRRLWIALGAGATLVAVAGFAQATASLQAALGTVGAGTVASYLVTTVPGRMALLRAVLAAVLVVAATLAARSRTWSLLLALPAAAGLVVAIALVSHAAAAGSTWLVVGDAIHVGAALLWVGSVAMLAWLPSWSRDEEAAVALAARNLSRIALWCVGVVLATGIVATVAELSGLADVVTTPYGRTLLVKHVLFLIVLLLAVSHRVRGLPMFFDAGRPERFRGAVRFESLVLLAVVAVSGLLTTMPPAVEMASAQSAPRTQAPSTQAPSVPAPTTSAPPPSSGAPATPAQADASQSGTAAAPAGSLVPVTGSRWVAQFGSDGPDLATGVGVRPDGSVVVAGYTTGSLPGATSAGESDVFVAAYTPDGRQQWLRQFGSRGFDRATALAVDAQGDAYVSGYTNNRMPLGDSIGSGDAFLAKVGPDGTLLWLRQFGTTGSDYARGVAVDATGNVFVAGDTNGTLEGASYLGGDSDAYVAKYDASGDLVWQEQFGGPGADKVNGITIDAAGNVLVTGVTTGSLPTNHALGDVDGFVGMFDNNGQRVWLRQFGSNAQDYAYAIAAGRDGGSFVTGYTYGSMPGQTSSGNIDGFLVHYDRNGNLLWARQFGQNEAVFDFAVAVDPSGNVLVGGWADYDLASASGAYGPWRAFVRDFGPNGDGTGVHQFGASDMEKPLAMAVGEAGDLFVATTGTLAAGGHPDTQNPPASANDALLVRFPPAP